MARLEGTWTALYTPFGSDGRLDEVAYRRLAERLVAAGSGLLACGTTGETPTLTEAEYVRCIEIAVDVGRGHAPVMVGTGNSSTVDSIAATRLAKELGADLALVVTPPYNKPPQKGLLAHFRAVADVGLPIVLYNVPGRTGANLLPATTLELAQDPRFVAIKEAGGSLTHMEALVAGARALDNGFSVLSGDDAMILPLVAIGGHGVVSVAGNVAPDAVVALTRAALAGDLDDARIRHEQLLPLFTALFLTSNPIPVKAAAAILGHARPDVRLPLTRLDADDPAERKILDALVDALALVATSPASAKTAETA